MIKELLLPALVGAIFGGGSVGAGVKFYMDHTYLPITKYEEDHNEHGVEHIELVASFDQSAQRATEQAQIYALQKQISEIRRQAARQNRGLTQYEEYDIKEMETKIDNLKGW